MSDYLRSGVDFLGRHKKKLITLGVLSTAGVFGYYYAKRMVQNGMKQVEELGKELQQHMLEQQQREDELKRIRHECSSMVQTFVPPLRSKIKLCTDPKPVTEKLKAFRQKKTPENTEDNLTIEALWNELKVVSISRLVSSLYALCILNALLRVQLHVLARIAFNEQLLARKQAQKGDNSNVTTQITRQVRERFLFAASDHLINTGEGMEILVERVSSAIQSETTQWLMGTDATVTRFEVLSTISAIRDKVEQENPESGEQSFSAWLTRCVIPADESSVTSEDRELSQTQNELLSEMLNETMDMIESPHFALAVKASLSNMFSVLLEELQTREFASATKPSAEKQSDGSSSTKAVAVDQEERFMLTKLIVTLLKQVASEVTSSAGEVSNKFMDSLKDIAVADELCTIIFNQGLESSSPLDALGDLGFGGEDMKAFTSLLSGAGGSEMDLMNLLGGEGQGMMDLLGGMQDPQAGGAQPQEAELMRMLSGMMGAAGAPPTENQPSTNAEIERLFGR